MEPNNNEGEKNKTTIGASPSHKKGNQSPEKRPTFMTEE